MPCQIRYASWRKETKKIDGLRLGTMSEDSARVAWYSCYSCETIADNCFILHEMYNDYASQRQTTAEYDYAYWIHVDEDIHTLALLTIQQRLIQKQQNSNQRVGPALRVFADFFSKASYICTAIPDNRTWMCQSPKCPERRTMPLIGLF
jgi:hypothetical protein